MYDPRTDPEVWRMVKKIIASGKIPDSPTCQLCGCASPLEMSLYHQAAAAFTSYDYLCAGCARSLGFTIMIDGD